jgi:hypothetical protein
VSIAFVKLVGQTANAGSASTVIVTVAAGGVAAGNTVIICLNANGAGTVNSISDTRGNAWVINNQSASTTGGQVVSSKITNPLLAGDTITVTGSASIAGRIAIAAEFSGVGVLDQVNSVTGVSTTATGSTTAPVHGGDLAIAFFGEALVTDDFQNLDANYTEIARQAGSSSRSLLMAYRLGIPAGVNTATCDFPASTTWRAGVAAYAPPIDVDPTIWRPAFMRGSGFPTFMLRPSVLGWSPAADTDTGAVPDAGVSPPAYVPSAPRATQRRSVGARRAVHVSPIPAQVAAPAAPAYVQNPDRPALRGLLLRRGRVAVAPAPQAPVPSPTRARRALLPRLRRAALTPSPAQVAPPPVARPRRLMLWRRGPDAPTPVPAQVAAPAPPPYPVTTWRPHRTLTGQRRGRIVTPVSAQQAAPTPPAYPPWTFRVRRTVTGQRRGKAQTPVPPQQAAAAPPPYPVWTFRVRRTMTGQRRAKAVAPIPPQQTAPTPPPYPAWIARPRRVSAGQRRSKTVAPVAAQVAAPAPPAYPLWTFRVRRTFTGLRRSKAVTPTLPRVVVAPPYRAQLRTPRRVQATPRRGHVVAPASPQVAAPGAHRGRPAWRRILARVLRRPGSRQPVPPPGQAAVVRLPSARIETTYAQAVIRGFSAGDTIRGTSADADVRDTSADADVRLTQAGAEMEP